MNLIPILLSILLPIGIAYVAVRLALTCRIHPSSRVVLIPDVPGGESPAGEIPSDIDSRRKVVLTVMTALGLVLVFTAILTALRYAEFFAFVLEPLARLLGGLGVNLVIAVVVAFILLSQVPVITSSFTWMSPRRGAMVGVILGIGVLAAWLLVDSWVTINLLVAVLVISTAVSWQPRMSYLKLFMILLIVAVVYDVVQVYMTDSMEHVARAMMPVVESAGAESSGRQLMLPMLFVLPVELSLDAGMAGLLGAGDVIVLSLMAIAAARAGDRLGSSFPLRATLAGYAVAMAACYTVMLLSNSGQPATIFIVPFCGAPVLWYAWRRGGMKHLRRPFFELPDEQSLATS